MSALTPETIQGIEDLGFSVSTWKTLRKHGVVTVDDLTLLTSMPCWATRLLQCGKRTALEIISLFAEEGFADREKLIMRSGLVFSKWERDRFETGEQNTLWMPMSFRSGNMNHNVVTGL